MNKIGTRHAVVAAMLLIAGPVVIGAGQATSKPAATPAAKHPWAGFNPGSWVKIRSSSVETSSKKETNVVESKITLVEKTADNVVLQTEMTAMGQTITTKSDMPIKGHSDAVPPSIKVLNRGSETITVAGRTVICETLEMSVVGEDPRVVTKTWSSDQVPGSLVRSVTTSGRRVGTAEVVDFKVQEEGLKARGR